MSYFLLDHMNFTTPIILLAIFSTTSIALLIIIQRKKHYFTNAWFSVIGKTNFFTSPEISYTIVMKTIKIVLHLQFSLTSSIFPVNVF